MSWLSPTTSSSLLRTSRRIITRTGRFTWCPKYAPAFSTQPPRDPLRILFCGSDSFSQVSLDALAKEHKRNPELIQSIDVVVRPPKPVGRGMKQLAPKGPMHTLATQYDLPIHEIDTFTGWNLPRRDLPINLIIAVSFGLFVPPRILRACEHGGLNVHPSLLPDLRGPAPLHHAIISSDKYTGVSLQTLSDKTFDAGTVLAQTTPPGVPIDPSWDVEKLSEHLARIGSDMLVKGLREGIYLPPHVGIGFNWQDYRYHVLEEPAPIRPAPKLEKFDFQIQWNSWTSSDAALRSVKLGEKLWTSAIHKKGHSQRWTMEGVEEASWAEEMDWFATYMHYQRGISRNYEIEKEISKLDSIILRQTLPKPTNSRTKSQSIFNADYPEHPQTTKCTTTPEQRDIRIPYFVDKDKQSIIVPMPRGGFIRIPKITVEGKTEQPAATVVEQYKQPKPPSSSSDYGEHGHDSGITFVFNDFARLSINPEEAGEMCDSVGGMGSDDIIF